MDLKPKELTEIKQQVSLVQQSAMALTVDSPESMSKATDALHNVRQAEKFITERKTNITKPIMRSLSQIRELFKPMELSLANANAMIKSKMLSYQIEIDAQKEKEQARIAARVAKGTMKAETAAQKLETLGEVNSGSQGEVGKSSIREVRKVRIVDETIIPREWLEPSITRITEAVIRQNIIIPGVEIYLEKMIVSR